MHHLQKCHRQDLPNIYQAQDHFRFFLPSTSSKRVFSTKRTSPFLRALIAASNCSPRVTPGKQLLAQAF